MYFYFVLFLVVVFTILHTMDRFSTETLLGIEKTYQEDAYIRNKLNEYRQTRDVLGLESNRIARCFMRKFGIHKGLWIMTLFVFIPMMCLLFMSIHSRMEYSIADDMIVFVVAFMGGLLTHQTLTALHARKILKKIKKGRDAI